MQFDPAHLAALEPDQFSAAHRTHLPRKELGRGAVILLSLLRVYVLIAIPVVAYAFFRAL